MPFFSQELWEQAEMTATNKAAENANVRAVNKKAAGPDGIDRLLREHKVDALIAPTVGPAWPSDLMTLNLQTNTSVPDRPGLECEPFQGENRNDALEETSL